MSDRISIAEMKRSESSWFAPRPLAIAGTKRILLDGFGVAQEDRDREAALRGLS